MPDHAWAKFQPSGGLGGGGGGLSLCDKTGPKTEERSSGRPRIRIRGPFERKGRGSGYARDVHPFF